MPVSRPQDLQDCDCYGVVGHQIDGRLKKIEIKKVPMSIGNPYLLYSLYSIEFYK
jgi:hypothetical protein